MDVATILLSARDKHLWLYYALMATAGSVLGAFLTFRLARKGGKEALTKKLSNRNVDKALKTFERWGFAAIVVPALLPPPFPLVPFVIAAGAMQYSLPKFLTAIAIGRFVRYTVSKTGGPGWDGISIDPSTDSNFDGGLWTAMLSG